jgi:hypothetical protein
VQVSTTDRITATFGPASALPEGIPFLRLNATPRIAFCARWVLSFNSPCSTNRISLGHNAKA